MSQCDVLVAGGGPVGTALAGDLLRHGVSMRIIDKAPQASTLSKAVVLMPRMLEEFELRGFVSEVLENVQPMRRWAAYAEGKLVLESQFHRLPTKYNYLSCIPQNVTERILRKQVEDRGGNVEWGMELIGFEDKGDHVVSEVRRPDGSVETVESKYLCGMGGAHSSVRHQLALPFKGAEYADIWALGDVKIDWDYPHDRANTFFHEEGFIATFPMPEGRTRIFAVAADPAIVGSETTVDLIQRLVDRWCFVHGKVSDPRWLSQFHVHHRMVSQYRVGNVFLGGDSAHIHSPLTGLGMNSGIQDSYNLAWKLAMAVKGECGDNIINSYHNERHAVGLEVVSSSHTVHTVWAQFGKIGELLRNRSFELFNQVYNVYYRPVEEQCQMSIDYRTIDHPVAEDHRRAATGISLGETAAAGRRALDAHVIELEGGAKNHTNLYSVLSKSTKHHLVVFSGMHADGADLIAARAALRVAVDFPSVLRPVWVAARADLDPGLGEATVLYDVTLEAHATYGAERCAAFIIRPDGYIGLRVLPATATAIRDFLKRYLN